MEGYSALDISRCLDIVAEENAITVTELIRVLEGDSRYEGIGEIMNRMNREYQLVYMTSGKIGIPVQAKKSGGNIVIKFLETESEDGIVRLKNELEPGWSFTTGATDTYNSKYISLWNMTEEDGSEGICTSVSGKNTGIFFTYRPGDEIDLDSLKIRTMRAERGKRYKFDLTDFTKFRDLTDVNRPYHFLFPGLSVSFDGITKTRRWVNRMTITID